VEYLADFRMRPPKYTLIRNYLINLQRVKFIMQEALVLNYILGFDRLLRFAIPFRLADDIPSTGNFRWIPAYAGTT
jgi:hypothetical protein